MRQLAIGNGQLGKTGRASDPEPPRYQQLDAWRYADDLAVDVYRLTRRLAPDLRSVVSQILRAAISVPANIAEGYGRGSDREFLQFLTIANASLYEVSYFLHFLRRIEAIPTEAYTKAATDCSRSARVLFGLMKSVSVSGHNGQRRYLSGKSKGPSANDD